MTDPPPASDQGPPKPAQQPLARPLGSDGARPASFDAQFRAQNKAVFRELVSQDVFAGGDPVERAHAYAERGKPEFVLAYLLVTDLPDAEKRELYAHAHDRRAQISDQKADELDRRFHRPFPLVRLEASKDRATAQRIRAGGALRPGLGRPLPTL